MNKEGIKKLIDEFVYEYQQDGMLPSIAKKRISNLLDQQTQHLNDRLKEREAEIVIKDDKINDLIKACNDYSDEVNQLQSTISEQQERIRELEKDVDFWKDKSFKLQQENLKHTL